MEITAQPSRQAFANVVGELRGLHAQHANSKADSFVQSLVNDGRLQPEGQVWWLAYGVHCILYATTQRTHHGRPILGKQYATFLFDPYRRSYMFKGRVQTVTNAWEKEILARSDAQYAGGLHELEALAEEERNALASADAGEAREQHVQDLAAVEQAITASKSEFVQNRANQQMELRQTAQTVHKALRTLRGRTYPAVDYFLRDLVAALPSDERSMPPRQLVQSMYTHLCHANGTSKFKEREVWPIFENDSFRSTADNYFGMRFDSLLNCGSSTRFGRRDLLPWLDRKPASEVGPRIPSFKHAMSDGRFQRMCKPMLLPIRHETMREAFRSHFLACLYFDERFQRAVAFDEDTLAPLPTNKEEGQAAHDARVRANAVAALKVRLPIANPAIARLMRHQRRAQRRAIVAQESFPVFANVPWRVSAQEAEGLRRTHVAFFKNLPRNQSDAHHGNCNSIGAALVKHAIAIQGGASEQALPKAVRGLLRTLGSHHTLRLPRCPPC